MKLWRRFWESWARLWKCFPPGYEYELERNMTGLLLGLVAVLSLYYFVWLNDECRVLYYMDSVQGKVVRTGVVAPSFLQLAQGYLRLFLPYFLFQAMMMAYRYLYYYRDTKSIYLMRRLPGRSVLAKSCLQAPLLSMAAGALSMAVLSLFYYGAYLLAIPAECMPRFL